MGGSKETLPLSEMRERPILWLRMHILLQLGLEDLEGPHGHVGGDGRPQGEGDDEHGDEVLSLGLYHPA